MEFCTNFNLTSFPVEELALCRFVAFLVQGGLSYASIRQYLCALRCYQLLGGGQDPCFSSLHRLHYLLRGVHRSLGPSSRPKRFPITPAILHIVYHHWSPNALNFNIVCLWAACCVGFFAFLRSGEFTCSSWSAFDASILALDGVAIDDRTNPSIVHLTLKQSKTDVFGAGVTIHLGRTYDRLCPVSALLAYLAVRPPTPGPLFLLSSGVPLSRRFLVTSVRTALSSVGIDTSRF